jgi:4-hydroxy-tetrahydrodipicolinate reductase
MAHRRIAVCGLGTIGSQVARLLIEHRRGVDLVAAASKSESQIERPLHEVLGLDGGPGPVVTDSIGALLAEHPDAVVLATGSFLGEVLDDVLACAGAGVSLVSPCEELAFPYTRAPDLAARIDAAAVEGGATILGTGVNPGFIFDTLVATATGATWDVTAIRGRRVVDTVEFGENIHLRLGIGYTADEFREGHDDGTIAGHVGFPESIQIVCERLGVPLDGPVDETFEPFVAETPAPTKYGAVEAGRTEGFVQRAVGMAGGREFIRLELVLHLRPREAGYDPVDTFEIDGLHPVRLTLDPGMDAVLATSAVLVNSLPGVIHAEPGLKTVKDLPAATAWLGDFEDALLR